MKLPDVFPTLQMRLATLQRDTRLIADEMDELAYGPASQLIWEGTGTEKLAAAAAGDTTGYHNALASLDALSRRLAQALQPAHSHPGHVLPQSDPGRPEPPQLTK